MEVQYVSWTRQSAAFFCCVAKLGESLTGRSLFAYVRGSQEDNSRRFSSFICICQRLLVVDDIYLHLPMVCNSLTMEGAPGSGSGCEAQSTSTLLPRLRWRLGFCRVEPWHCDKDHLYTQWLVIQHPWAWH